VSTDFGGDPEGAYPFKLARDRAVEDWLRGDVAAAYDALKADPSSAAISVDQVKAGLAARHRKAVAAST
jgi:hypothetical protein